MFSRIFLLVAVLAAPLTAEASFPSLGMIMPRGIQRGHQHELVFSGARLEEAQEVLLYFDGITVDAVEQIDASQVKVTLTVAADCRVGEHVAQLRTAHGITEYRTFFVGPYPAVPETEPNNDPEQIQAVDFNTTITGTIAAEDQDRFQVTATAGQRVSVEVEGIRLGTIMIDPFLTVTGPDGSEVATQDDTPLLRQDCFVSFVAPVDGTYNVLLRDASYGGNGNGHYRLHVGNFPRPTVVFPPGGPPGGTLPVEFVDVAGGPLTQEISIPAEVPSRRWLVASDDQGSSPSPVEFRVSDLPNQMEVEPNQDMDQATPVSIPGAFNGRLQEAGDEDWFVIEGKKDQVFNIEVYSRRLNSPVDALLNVWGPDRKHISGNDDSRGPDPYLRFQMPADGKYYLRVRDHLQRGGQEFVYRIEISPVKPALTVAIPRVDRYSQGRQRIFVPRGNRFGTLIAASRSDFGGQIKLLEDNLPAGISMVHQPMAGNLNLMPVVFEASADAEIGGGLVDLRAAHVDDGTGITGGFSNHASMVLGQPNNAEYIGCDVDRVAMAVINPVPFHVEIVQPAAPLVREGTIGIRVVARRDEGFTAPINLQFPFRPPGVGATGQITIPEGQTEAVYQLDANANAQIGSWPICVLATADVNGPAWISSQLAELVVADRYVTVELQRAGCEQGQETQFVGKFNHVTEFEGSATAELLGIPAHAEVAPVQFDKTTGDVVFVVKTKPETPAGKHTGVFCRVTIPVNGETVVATAGRSELQVDAPLPTESAAPPPPPPAPTEKPLSRLEKLRQAAQSLQEAEKQ